MKTTIFFSNFKKMGVIGLVTLFLFSSIFEKTETLFAASPSVVTGSASLQTKTSASLSGSVSGNGGADITSAGFEYGTTVSYGSSVPANTTYSYNSQFGSAGSGNGQFVNPYGISSDGSGNIYVVDAGNDRIQKFDSNGVYVSQFGSAGSGDGQFADPFFIAFDSSDNIYVADTNNNRIQKFDSNGVYVSQFGSAGSGDGQFTTPIGIAFDSSDNIYVADTNNNRIQKFDSNGVYVSQFGSAGSGDGQFNQSIMIDINSAGDIYVTDYGNHRIQKFDSNGVYVSQFGTSGVGNGQFSNPVGLFIDNDDNIYVADAGNDRIQKFDSSGAYVSKFGTTGTGNGQFGLPYSLFLNSVGDIYVTDFTLNRVQKFSTQIATTSITSLTCGTTYHFRAFAVNADGTGYGDDNTFETLDCEPPEVDTLSASSLTQTSAILRGLYVDMPVTPGLTRGFQYGQTASYGQIFTENGNELKQTFGSAGALDGEFNAPQGIAISETDNSFYVVDTGNNRVQKFNKANNSWILNIVGNGGDFSSPTNIYVDANEKVYVADVGNNRVQRFSSTGVFELEIGTGLFGTTFTVAVDSTGNIYVADPENGRIAKFDPSGVYLEDFGGVLVLGPLSLDFDSAGNVYISDPNIGQIRKLDSAGTTVLADIGTFGSVYHPRIDSDDNLYVVDNDNVQILKYDSSGNLLYTFADASGLFVDTDSSGNIYMPDNANSDVNIFNLGFSTGISSLTCGTTYHYRAFATNADGTGYGDDATFSTSSCGSTGGTTVYGCTDPSADNYNSSATVDNGSCEYFGCMDREATNFDPIANVHIDDYCIYNPGAINGCTDPSAGNYNPSATVDDGSCLYGILGCMDSAAINYNPNAVYSDGSCQFPGDPPTTIYGCTTFGALNYNSSATVDDGSCNYTNPIVYGCTDISATNYSSSANQNDGSCFYGDIDGDDDVWTDVVTGVSGFVQKEEVLLPIAIAGLLVPAAITGFLQPGLLAFALSVPIRLWNLIPVLMGYRRRKRPWGTVFDSITKQPLDPVYVKLLGFDGAEKSASITDMDGRYGFLTEAGIYKIFAGKDNYEFPSKKLFGKDHDELYDNLYFGEDIEVKEKEDVVFKNIPMDPINFNWNEFTKAENKKLMKFYSKRDLSLARIANILFIAGLISSIILFALEINILNSIILGLYALIIILRFFGIKPRQAGYVFDQDGFPLSFGIVRVFSSGLGREVAHSVIGKTGKYYSLVPNGEYYMKISKKTGENSYEEVLVTDSFKVSGGHIKEKISL